MGGSEVDRKVLIRVALPLNLAPLTYRLPDRNVPTPGTRVLVPLGQRELIGFVVDQVDQAPVGARCIRGVLEVLDSESLFPLQLFQTCRWAAEYYLAPLGQVLRTALPPGLVQVWGRRIRLRAMPSSSETLSSLQRSILSLLWEKSPRTDREIRRRVQARTGLLGELERLAEAGWVTVESVPPKGLPRPKYQRLYSAHAEEGMEEALVGAPRQLECFLRLRRADRPVEEEEITGEWGFDRRILKALVEKGVVVVEEVEAWRIPDEVLGEEPLPDRLTPDQAGALEEVLGAVDRGEGEAVLLYGVTGSGKTLVYLEALQTVIGRGRQGIVLVPEIGLTAQAMSRFRGRFGDRVTLLHSRLSAGERFDAWRRIRQGGIDVVVGPRSAVFAPVPRLGLIIIDEEHDEAYKQEEAPRYHAREVALQRAREEGAALVLGSATPAVESFHRAQAGDYSLRPLPSRYGGPLPEVTLVDLRKEGMGRGLPIFSRHLAEALGECLGRGEQAMLLLNRRGFATYVQCPGCGYAFRCPYCQIALTLHRRRGRLVCHYCHHHQPAPEGCPACGRPVVSSRGLGTERVEVELKGRFPAAQLARLDLDAVTERGGHARILRAFQAGEVDVLIGTQMIAKGHHFPRVTLVGVISADTALHLPDFRAGERTFQLLTQVTGRAGRGDRPGRVFVQTYLPDHWVLETAARQDYEAFWTREMASRTEARYPPVVHLVNVVVSGRDEEEVRQFAESAAEHLRRRAGDASGDVMEVLGPAPCPLSRLRGRYRWHVLAKGSRPDELGALCHGLQGKLEVPSRAQLRLSIDRDPLSLL